MIASMGEGTEIDPELIPRCPHCGAEAFPWVRGYGNFLEGSKYEAEYQKTSDYIETHADERLLFIELGVGRLTPMFIQEPFAASRRICRRRATSASTTSTIFCRRASRTRA